MYSWDTSTHSLDNKVTDQEIKYQHSSIDKIWQL